MAALLTRRRSFRSREAEGQHQRIAENASLGFVLLKFTTQFIIPATGKFSAYWDPLGFSRSSKLSVYMLSPMPNGHLFPLTELPTQLYDDLTIK